MNVRISAELVDERGRPLANTPVRVNRVLLRGGMQLLAEGRTDARGRVDLTVEGLGDDLEPRLVLHAYVNNAYRLVSTAPVTQRGSTLSFGVITVSRTPVTDIDGVSFHGVLREDAPVQPVVHRTSRETTARRIVEPTPDLDVGPVAGPVAEVQQLRNQIEHVLMEKDAVQQQLRTVESELDGLRNTVSRLEGETGRLADERNTVQAEAQQLQNQLDQALTERNQRADQLEAASERIRELEQQLSAEQEAEIPVTELFARAGEQFSAVNDRLDTAESVYRLGDVKMEMKVLLSPDNQRARIPGFEELADLDVGGLTTITVDFEKPATTPSTADHPSVPDVRGYTRTLAERRLRDAGFRPRFVYQHVPAERADAEHGRVLDQTPAAGAKAPRATEIELFVGRAER